MPYPARDCHRGRQDSSRAPFPAATSPVPPSAAVAQRFPWPPRASVPASLVALVSSSVRVCRLSREDQSAPWAAVSPPAQDGQGDGRHGEASRYQVVADCGQWAGAVVHDERGPPHGIAYPHGQVEAERGPVRDRGQRRRCRPAYNPTNRTRALRRPDREIKRCLKRYIARGLPTPRTPPRPLDAAKERGAVGERALPAKTHIAAGMAHILLEAGSDDQALMYAPGSEPGPP